MANIKLFGNTKIQGKTLFALSEPAPVPTYSITKNKTTVLEGSSVIFTLNTTNVANGTVLPYTITGISASDVTSGSLTGNFTVSNNTATTTIEMAADQANEGVETATLTLNNAAASGFVLVNDSFTNEYFEFEVIGDNTAEGSNVNILLIAQNVSDGAIIPYTISGVTSEDINGASLTGNFTLGYNEDAGRYDGFFSLSFAPDLITEGNETLTISLDNRLVTHSFQIIDSFTSAPPSYTITANKASVNEGETIQFTINTTNVLRNTLIPFTITGISRNDLEDFYYQIDGSSNISIGLNGVAYLFLKMNSDSLTEGTENMVLTLGNNLASLTIPVNDTSKQITIPSDKIGLLGWFDSNESQNVINTIGITDNNATITTTGFPTNASLNKATDGNGNVGYANIIDGTAYGIAKINNAWKYVSIYYFSGDEDNGSFMGPFTEVTPSIVATGNTQYPWQATWPAGKTVVRNGVANDVVATNGQKIISWKNKVTGKQAALQNTLSLQPVLSSDGILFNNNYFLYFFSFLGVTLIFSLCYKSMNNFLLILLLILGNPQLEIYHKYYEPMLLIMFFTLFNINIDNQLLKKRIPILYTFSFLFLIANLMR